MNFRRILTVATNVYWEVIRDRILYLIIIFALLMGASVRLIPQLAATTENKIILDIGLAAMSLLGLIVAVFVAAGLVNKEIEKRTVYLLVAKPISRAELIVGKHLGLSAVLLVLVAAMTVIYLAILNFSRIPYPLVSILIAALFVWFELCLMAGVGILFGVFSSSLLATLLTFGVYLVGHSTRDLVALGKLSKNPGIEQLMMGLYLVLPDLARFNLRNDAVYGQVPYLAGLITDAGYGLLYVVLLLSIAIAIFSQREF
ncbi:ABC transporter permease [Microcoleus sp. herbarium12]|jgi:Cu-processing system permease protein|uniref:ABC transporter permease n=1 Tax=Microcoleus sp. herbarium12 TaxID=3055437 RepID=UPI002FD44059